MEWVSALRFNPIAVQNVEIRDGNSKLQSTMLMMFSSCTALLHDVWSTLCTPTKTIPPILGHAQIRQSKTNCHSWLRGWDSLMHLEFWCQVLVLIVWRASLEREGVEISKRETAPDKMESPITLEFGVFATSSRWNKIVSVTRNTPRPPTITRYDQYPYSYNPIIRLDDLDLDQLGAPGGHIGNICWNMVKNDNLTFDLEWPWMTLTLTLTNFVHQGVI